ncbi:TIR domain-containing protein [Cohnella lubricantis]|uniref:TIR domain-containing protein n=1 Tax=Cohnella lubricantis TaxID=2163172 RepID=A0A841TAT2_9BACL|nr:TIR domain-containing protein [Cohnella lubricantis]MBB6678102.1 TIR domain-containing protein [Cohnella lubricantis]MBP2120464.1 hypothetical protein [Cohnella lubricantis]
MGHKCFISFKTEDLEYKEYIQKNMDIDMIDQSLNDAIDSEDEDYILRKIREDYLSTSTVTIHLIGNVSSEKLGYEEQKFIKRELQASLYNGKGNTRNGILGVVLPSMYKRIYLGSYTCSTCGQSHNAISINDDTTIKEFSYNYFIPNSKCVWYEEDRYCVLVKWDEFEANPEKFIQDAFDKRNSPIASKIKVRP